MRRTLWFTSSLVLLVAGATACNHGTVDGADPSGTAAMETQVAEVVFETERMVGDMVGDELNSRAAADGTRASATIDVSFTRTRSCPLGGEVTISADLHRTIDFDTATMEATFSGEKTLTDCAFMKREHVITVNGSAMWDAFRRRVNHRPDGLQTTTYSGSITAVRDDGEERSCDFSIEAIRDPETHTRTVTGTICGDEFSSTVTWDPGS